MFLRGLDLLKAPAHPGFHQPEWYHLLHKLNPQAWANPDTPGLLRALFYDVSLAPLYSHAHLSQVCFFLGLPSPSLPHNAGLSQ